MRKFVLSFFIVLCLSCIYSQERNVINLIENNFIPFDLINFEDKATYLGFVVFDKGTVSCGYGGGIQACLLKSFKYTDCGIEIFFERTIFSNIKDKNFKYRKWLFPILYRTFIPFTDVERAFEQDIIGKVYVNISFTYPTTCQAIVIDNLNIRDKPSLNGNKIGQLEKRREVTLYEQSKNLDEIDGEKNPWYKVKLDDNTYGWVYGGYVRIFFEDPNLGYSDKELILKSIE